MERKKTKPKKRNYAATEGTLINVRAAKKRTDNITVSIQLLLTSTRILAGVYKDLEKRVKKLEGKK